MTKQEIYKIVDEAESRVLNAIAGLKTRGSVLNFEPLVQNNNWTRAIQKAVDEYEIIHQGEAMATAVCMTVKTVTSEFRPVCCLTISRAYH